MDFGKRAGGGRRSAKRVDAPLPALLVTMSDRHRALLYDISSEGAHLRAQEPPPRGSELFLQVEGLEIYAQVIWRRGEHCGLKFDGPLPPYELHLLTIEAGKGTRAKLTPSQKGGADDWTAGVAR